MDFVYRNARLVAPLAVLHITVYTALNQYPPFPSRRLPLTALDRWIPFWTWTVWPYFLLIAMAVVLPLLVRRRKLLRRMLVAYAISMGTAGLFFLFLPTHYPRPAWPLDDSLHAAVYRWLTIVDTPQCCFPSSHIVVPILACVGLWRDRWRGRLPLALLMGICTLAILTTKQHYVWDWLGGSAVAGIGAVLSGLVPAGSIPGWRRLTGRRRTRSLGPRGHRLQPHFPLKHAGRGSDRRSLTPTRRASRPAK